MNLRENSPLPNSVRRICVIGTTGSGKSTLALELARRLGIPLIELDALNWEPNWIEAPRGVIHQRVEILTRGSEWVMDGNYSYLRDVIWPRAQVVIWLDYSLPIILWRLWCRTWRRSLKKEILWGTNKERLFPQFFSKDSLFLWALKSYKRHRKTYSTLLESSEYRHLILFHFSNPKETHEWLKQM